MKKLYALMVSLLLLGQASAGIQTVVVELPRQQLSFTNYATIPGFNTNLGTFVNGTCTLQFDSEYYFRATNRSRANSLVTLKVDMMPMLNGVVTTTRVYDNSFVLGPNGGNTNFTIYSTVYQTEMCGPEPTVITYGLRPWTQVTVGGGNGSVRSSAYASGYLVVTYEYECLGVGSQGFWKNHPEAWPVEELEIAGIVYTKDAAISVLNTPTKRNKTIIALKQVIAAKLNVISCDDDCVNEYLQYVEEWLAGASYTWNCVEVAVNVLEQYNNGNLCREHR